MLRPHINLSPVRPARPTAETPVRLDQLPNSRRASAVARLLATTRNAAGASVAATPPSRPASHQEERCCVYCGHSLYTPPKATQVRCPCCVREISVLDITLSGDVARAEEIVTAGKITVAMGARVATDLVACSVEVYGKVLGDVLASQVCRVRCTAKLSGRILCRQLIIEPGAQVEGLVETITEPGER
jgi:hypothetical protein